MASTKAKTVEEYSDLQNSEDKKICELLRQTICTTLSNSTHKIWHGAPVWFMDENPIVAYSKQKSGIRLMFFSGADFGEAKLLPGSGKFKDASIFYNLESEVDSDELVKWLNKSKNIQWDYKNIVKNKGLLAKK